MEPIEIIYSDIHELNYLTRNIPKDAVIHLKKRKIHDIEPYWADKEPTHVYKPEPTRSYHRNK